MMVNQALQQRNTQWAAEQTLFMTIVRPMLAFFEAFIYAISPIMAFVIVLGAQGIKLAGKYFLLLIWIQLWMPLLGIVNLYIFSAASRSIASYGEMTTHNWDSFYSLNAAADTMQHWIATGGLLAASTPAIALMLIYGSAVTATHLAGRLKSSDNIDEGYMTPGLKNNPPLANLGAMYNGDTVSGIMRTGSESTVGNAQIGQILGHQVSSTRQNLSQKADQATDALSSSISSGSTASQQRSRAEDIGRSVESSDTLIAQNARDYAKNLVDTNTIGAEHKEAAQGVFAASIGADGNLNAGKFMSLMDGMGIGLKGGVSGKISDTNIDGTSHSANNTLQNSAGYKYSDSQVAKFGTDMSASLRKSEVLSNTNTWSSADSSNLTRSMSELTSASDSYQTMDSMNTAFQSGANFNLKQVAGLAAGIRSGNSAGNSQAQETLNSGMSLQPQQVQQAAQSLYSHYRQMGMQEEVARNTANLSALLNPTNYTDEKTGLDNQAYINGSQLAGHVINQATGHSMPHQVAHGGDKQGAPPGYSWNETLNSPQAGNEQVAERASRNAPVARQNQLGDAGSLSDPGMPGQSSLVNHDYLDNRRSNRENGADREANMVNNSGETQQARSRIMRDVDPNLGTTLSAASNWAGNKYDQLMGAASEGASGYQNNLSEQLTNYKNMTPEGRQQFKQQLNERDNALFDNAGAWGAYLKGPSYVGNAVGGLIMEGYEAYSGGNTSLPAQELSQQEKGAYLWGAYAGALNQGIDTGAAFMQSEQGQQLQDIMQKSIQDYGLTPAQSAVFAAQFDTNPENMQHSVSNLQRDYAIRDDQGMPMRDNDGGWKMTPENRELVEAMVDRIGDASNNGDYAGSFLLDIQRYNNLTKPVSPSR